MEEKTVIGDDGEPWAEDETKVMEYREEKPDDHSGGDGCHNGRPMGSMALFERFRHSDLHQFSEYLIPTRQLI